MKAKLFIVSSIVAVVGFGLGSHFLKMADINTNNLSPSKWLSHTELLTQERVISFDGVNSVNINTAGDIVIHQSNDKNGKLVITAKAGGIATTAIQTKNNTLSINDNNITAIDLTVPYTVKTINANSYIGDIDIKKTSASVLSINATTGDVTIIDPEKNLKEMNINTVSGDIHVNIDGNPHFLIEAKSVNGDVSIKDELKNSASKNGKSGFINLHSVSGDINVK